MNTEYFPHFLRSNIKDIIISNEDAIEIGDEFKKYLLEKFKGNTDKLNEWWNIDPINIITNMEHPLKINGYEPALVLHFTEFIKSVQPI